MSCRKKIDSKIWLDYVTMETEVQNLKKDLNRTRNDLKISKKKCRELVKNLDNQKIYHQSEHNLRDKQLTKILRALLVLESRLRQEQKTIRQQLIEKDNTIRTQQMEISRLRRQTKNYIKINNRENNNNNNNNINIINPGDLNNDKESDNCNYINDIGITGLNNNNLRNHINRLKLELVNKIGSYDNVNNNNNYEFGVKKTDSFAGSDVSKESIGSENTDASILTTTTEGSLSVLSTEGFCEGESTDVSPGSTLNKSSRYKNLNIETDMCIKILDCHDNNDDDVDKYSKRRLGVSRTEPMEIFNNQICKISRSDSKDDGMDCNFISGEEEDDDDDDDDDGEEKEDTEPIYVNACSNDNNSTKNIDENDVKILNDKQFNSNINNEDKNNNKNRSLQLQPQDKSIEETSGNWYSDPDEDRISEEFSRHNTYRTNSKHNSVLECVNQILLRDMEDEENIQSVSKKFKHRGRIVSFQPARLSDIESVGSEMERRNSEEVNGDKESQNFESNNSEDDYIIINNNNNNNNLSSTITSSECIDSESGIDEEIIDNNGLARAIPIVIIEPDINDINRKLSSSPNLSIKTCNSSNNNSLIRLESIEEKTCLSMSTKNLTIAKNLDYEDIESLPDITLKTPPALPPKPKFRTNTLILKKIPSPSFFIDENKNKNSNRDTYIRNYYKTNKQINKTTGTTSARSLVFRKKSLNDVDNINYDILNNNNNNNSNNDLSLIPRVGNIVRHFEEFKIGSDTDIRINKTKDHKIIQKIDEIDIRQNFEEFNFDDCDLSDDPDRLDGDGSDKLVNNIIKNHDNDTSTSSTPSPSSPSSPTKTTNDNNNHSSGIYDHFLEATGLSTKSILTPSRLISNHRDMLKPKDIKYKNKIKSNTINDKNNCSTTSGSSSSSSQTHVKHWTGPFV